MHPKQLDFSNKEKQYHIVYKSLYHLNNNALPSELIFTRSSGPISPAIIFRDKAVSISAGKSFRPAHKPVRILASQVIKSFYPAGWREPSPKAQGQVFQQDLGTLLSALAKVWNTIVSSIRFTRAETHLQQSQNPCLISS